MPKERLQRSREETEVVEYKRQGKKKIEGGEKNISVDGSIVQLLNTAINFVFYSVRATFWGQHP